MTISDLFTYRPTTSNYIIIGGSVVGIGALCLYGLGIKDQSNRSVVNSIEKEVWPGYVQRRVRNVFLYLTAGVGVTAAGAVLAQQSPDLISTLTNFGIIPLTAASALTIYLSGSITRCIAFENTFVKHLAWTFHYGVAGAIIPAVCRLGGPSATRGFIYFAGMLLGGGIVASCAPSRDFFATMTPIGNILGVAIASNATSFYMPRSTELAGWPAVIVYGGLTLFGIYDHWDHFRVIVAAERIPAGGGASPNESYLDKCGGQAMISSSGSGDFDPINAQMSCIMDAPNLLLGIKKPECCRK